MASHPGPAEPDPREGSPPGDAVPPPTAPTAERTPGTQAWSRPASLLDELRLEVELPEDVPSGLRVLQVRVRFLVLADGSSQVTLVAGSGFPSVDRQCLEQLAAAHWLPAVQEGSRVASVQEQTVRIPVSTGVGH